MIMIKVKEFRGRAENKHHRPEDVSPAAQLELFLEKEKISRGDIISIKYSSDHDCSVSGDFYSILLVYEKESK